MNLSFAATAAKIRDKFVADFHRLPSRVRARRMHRWVKARLQGLRLRRPVWRVRQLRPRRPMLPLPRPVLASPVLLPRPGPARIPAKICGP
jgi:hypothetical protein